ncbi:PREDICTED: uncharacterized protein LOC108370819 [Rhagoletis zephyria]|uniref:uncharacterized protein LOC108368946 n=1 Tax=Rhagoletis zephyria TaxID=28612 RepID=UPI0008114968|nr:PREDICTED: uncharacterized protein LOC108368946 [Rhagoletis zephyria]XP_017481719.1 PREDICTED: uncharacterized protein LOC108370819 [Rhagoletis zephyria]XP_036320247.1 uncharacterized protein LOC118734648 [Rhagoletis pomonella]
MHTKVILSLLFAFIVIFANLCTTIESRKVIFYNRQPTVQKSQLLSTQIMSKPCPAGKMRDHRNRCRRAIIFSRKSK